MLKRIAVVGTTSADELEKQSDEQIHFTELTDGALPNHADAMIPGLEHESVIPLATALAERSNNVLLLLAEAIDCRESFVPGSSQRLLEHATAFSRALGLSKSDQVLLERGALLRDIGKLQIKNDVLLKDGLLTYDEWELIHRHPHIGADMVKEMEGISDLEPIIRHHHETWDGDGYPDKLEGEDIPYLARALKIIDVYCAMTSPRPYRDNVHAKDGALEHIASEKGKHFDPEMVDVFLENDIAGDPLEQS